MVCRCDSVLGELISEYITMLPQVPAVVPGLLDLASEILHTIYHDSNLLRGQNSRGDQYATAQLLYQYAFLTFES